MKQIYLILGLLILLTSCNLREKGTYLKSVEGLDFEIIVIDGCQYLRRSAGYSGYLAHKGNCTNSIHIYKPGTNEKMLEKLYRELDSITEVINSY